MKHCITIYHNQKCSKSREALDYLRTLDLEVHVVDYIESPLTEEELRGIVKKLGVSPSSLVRPSDFQRLGLQAPTEGDGWLQLLAKHPALLVRPIVVSDRGAKVGRPIEQLADWIGQLVRASGTVDPPETLQLRRNG